jgi:23S rRNA-/tRNA-specific pseudouridylate synthase
VVVKPNGLPIHRGKRSLQNILRDGAVLTPSLASDAVDPPVVLSSLSKETGGCVLVAKTAAAAAAAAAASSTVQGETRFQALVVMEPAEEAAPAAGGDAAPGATAGVDMSVRESVPSVRFGSVARVTVALTAGTSDYYHIRTYVL